MTALPDEQTGAIVVTATNTDPEQAEAVASAFAEELVAEMAEDDLFVYEARLADAQTRSVTLQQQVTQLEALAVSLQEANPDDPALRRVEADLSSVSNQYQQAFAEADALVRVGPPRPALTTLERPHATPVDRQPLRLPDSEPTRAGLLGVFGILAGIAVAVATARPDTRIHDRSDAEESFSVPVLAEIPSIPGLKRGGELLAVTDPGSPYVEPFRSLSTVVLYAAATAAHEAEADLVAGGRAERSTAGHVRPRHVAVRRARARPPRSPTSPSSWPRAGRRARSVPADLRRPRVHELFGIEAEPGIVDVLGDPCRRDRAGRSASAHRGPRRLPAAVGRAPRQPCAAPAGPRPASSPRPVSCSTSSSSTARRCSSPTTPASSPTPPTRWSCSPGPTARAGESAERPPRSSAGSEHRCLGSVIVAGPRLPASYRYAYRSAYVGGAAVVSRTR